MECLHQWSSNLLLLFVAVVVAAADLVVVAVAVVVAVVVAVREERFPKPIYTNSRSTAPGGHFFSNNLINYNINSINDNIDNIRNSNTPTP